jgi:hypothetical protein
VPADRERLGQDPVNGPSSRQSDPLAIVAIEGLSLVRSVFPCRLGAFELGHFFSQQALEDLPLDRVGFG